MANALPEVDPVEIPSTDESRWAAAEMPTGAGPPKLVSAGDLAYLLYAVLPLRWLCGAARLQGRLEARLRRRMFETVRDNVAPLLSGAEIPRTPEQEARLFFADQQVRRLLLVVSPRMDLAAMDRYFTIEGIRHLDAALEAGRGVIMLFSHLNSLGGFLFVMQLRKMGYDVRVALPTMDDPWAATRFRRVIERILGPQPGVPALLGGFHCQFNIRPIVKALREGAVVGQTGDGWHAASFVDVEFLGRRVPFPTGVMSVARTTGSVVLPVFPIGRAPDMRFVCEPSFTVTRETGALEGRVAHFAARLEHYVRAYPAAWEHWTIPNTLETLASWRDRPLEEKYSI